MKTTIDDKIEFTYDKKRKCWLNKINSKNSNILVQCEEYVENQCRGIFANWNNLEGITQIDIDIKFYQYTLWLILNILMIMCWKLR